MATISTLGTEFRDTLPSIIHIFQLVFHTAQFFPAKTDQYLCPLNFGSQFINANGIVLQIGYDLLQLRVSGIVGGRFRYCLHFSNQTFSRLSGEPL